MIPIETSPADLTRILQNQRGAFEQEGPVALATRIDRIDRCIVLIVDHQDALCAAVNEDFGVRSHRVTRMSDLFTSVNTLKFVKKNIRKWMKPERRRAPFPMNLLGARADIYYQPKGVVGIMSPWNVPINVVFSPLADVLGAGNRAMIKPSEFNPATVALLSELFSQYFDETEIAVVSGGADVGEAFSALPLDHIIFTGAGQVGKLVMQSAAQNLTPEGENWDDRTQHRMPIHLVIDPSDDMEVMQEELFGPVLCVRPYREVDDCIADINRRPRPLAMYYFGNDKTEQEHLIANTIAGGMSINDIGVHFACDDMPFGGVGASGMGHFHGREGFKTFSHAKSVFRQGILNLPKLSGTLPPYGDKVDRIMDSMIKK